MTTPKKKKRKRAPGAGRPPGAPNKAPKKEQHAVTVRLPTALYARLGEEPTAEATRLLTAALEKP